MSRPRKRFVCPSEIAIFHCWSRCVRRAFLCGRDPRTGGDYGHRREWIARRLRHLAAGFAIDVFTYAVLENHLHVVPRARPDLAANWSDEEIAKRWWHVCPLRKDAHGEPASHPRQVELNVWLSLPMHWTGLSPGR